jgi:hypothetical protein
MRYLLFSMMFLLPAAAFAQADPESVDTLLNGFVMAVQTDQWLVAAGIATTLIVVLLRRTGALDAVPLKAMPWVASAVAIASSIATSLVSGVGLVEALTQGFLVGAAASGFWELVVKHTKVNQKL